MNATEISTIVKFHQKLGEKTTQTYEKIRVTKWSNVVGPVMVFFFLNKIFKNGEKLADNRQELGRKRSIISTIRHNVITGVTCSGYPDPTYIVTQLFQKAFNQFSWNFETE